MPSLAPDLMKRFRKVTGPRVTGVNARDNEDSICRLSRFAHCSPGVPRLVSGDVRGDQKPSGIPGPCRLRS